jgi:hypothetical protein
LAFCCHSAVYAPSGPLSTLPVTALFTEVPRREILRTSGVGCSRNTVGPCKRVNERGEAMRKVVAAEFVSLDGVMESPEKWHFPYFNEEMGQAVG